jgi:putative spermidine/putrescine transport system ATP-binding protein
VTVDPEEGSLENIFEGTVRQLIYLGDHIRTRVNVCGNNDRMRGGVVSL